MTTITHDRNGASVSADVFTESPDSSVLLYKTEHTDKTPSTLELARKLPAPNGQVRRIYLNRRRGFTLNPGTADAKDVLALAKLELSIPVGLADSEVETLIHDIVGMVATTEFGEARQFGIVQL